MAAITVDEAKAKDVLRQVEFYFSDSNLPRDKFLKKTIEESEDGLVSLALICSFSRMKMHLGLDAKLKPEDITEETVRAVSEVLKKSTSLRLSEDGKKVGRVAELINTHEILEQVNSRTVAASPLPYDTKLEDVESFFGQHGKINSVRLPRHVANKKVFSGTAMIEFSEEADAEKILKEDLVYSGAKLEMKWKKEFDSEREKQRDETEISQPEDDSSDESYPKGLIIAFKLEKRCEKATAQIDVHKVDSAEGDKIEVDSKDSDPSTQHNEKESKEETEKQNREASKKENELKDRKSPESVITREDLRAVFQKFGSVKYIDFSMGEESGYIRYENSDSAVKARATAALSGEGGMIVKNCIATVEALTGEPEKQYWSKLQDQRDKSKGNNRGNRGRGGAKFGRGGRHFNGKRSRDSAERYSNKAQKV